MDKEEQKIPFRIEKIKPAVYQVAPRSKKFTKTPPQYNIIKSVEHGSTLDIKLHVEIFFSKKNQSITQTIHPDYWVVWYGTKGAALNINSSNKVTGFVGQPSEKYSFLCYEQGYSTEGMEAVETPGKDRVDNEMRLLDSVLDQRLKVEESDEPEVTNFYLFPNLLKRKYNHLLGHKKGDLLDVYRYRKGVEIMGSEFFSIPVDIDYTLSFQDLTFYDKTFAYYISPRLLRRFSNPYYEEEERKEYLRKTQRVIIEDKEYVEFQNRVLMLIKIPMEDDKKDKAGLEKIWRDSAKRKLLFEKINFKDSNDE